MNAFWLVLLASLLFFSAPTSAKQGKSPFKEGTHYQRLPFLIDIKESDTIEIALFFSYGAPNSYELEPVLLTWLSDAHPRISFKRYPVTAGDARWLLYAKIYYGARTLGLHNKTHTALFDAVHKGDLNTLEEATAFYAEYGLSETRFLESLTTTKVHNDLLEARAATIAYQVRSVPMVVVGGRYRLVTENFESPERLLECLNFLVQNELGRYRLGENLR